MIDIKLHRLSCSILRHTVNTQYTHAYITYTRRYTQLTLAAGDADHGTL